MSLAKFAKDNGIAFFLFNFTDLLGVQRSKLVPTSAVEPMEQSGAGFAGFAAWLDLTPADADMFVIPDAGSVIQLPWRGDVAWVAGDPYMHGAPLDQGPRNVLKRVIAQAEQRGLHMKVGVEPEFHLISADGRSISDSDDTQSKPCYDQSALMRRLDVIAEICTSMETLGWRPYQNDHEDANGQFEINWHYADALTMADQLCFFKFMVKSIAEKHGYRATFMPKPFEDLTGNGCHTHISLWSAGDGQNLFEDLSDSEGQGLSKLAYQFIAGLLDNAQGLVSLTNSSVNSYKRINAKPTHSGATWSPNSISYAGNNRTHMIRIPDAGRIELRLPDSSANPYLMMAGILAAGLDGISREAHPGARIDANMYTDLEAQREAKQLPKNLLDALRSFESNSVLGDALGKEFSRSFIKLKNDEWSRYCASISPWERENTLDC
jgi:glutamine synthetase type III